MDLVADLSIAAFIVSPICAWIAFWLGKRSVRTEVHDAELLLRAWQEEMIHERHNAAAVRDWLRRNGTASA
jgi:hypothetical protein